MDFVSILCQDVSFMCLTQGLKIFLLINVVNNGQFFALITSPIHIQCFPYTSSYILTFLWAKQYKINKITKPVLKVLQHNFIIPLVILGGECTKIYIFSRQYVVIDLRAKSCYSFTINSWCVMNYTARPILTLCCVVYTLWFICTNLYFLSDFTSF